MHLFYFISTTDAAKYDGFAVRFLHSASASEPLKLSLNLELAAPASLGSLFGILDFSVTPLS